MIGIGFGGMPIFSPYIGLDADSGNSSLSVVLVAEKFPTVLPKGWSAGSETAKTANSTRMKYKLPLFIWLSLYGFIYVNLNFAADP